MAEPATPRLSNNEFRDFIMTPRAGGNTSARSGMNHSEGGFKRPNTPNPHKQKKPQKSKPAILKNPEYVDRAAERRTGKSEYEDGEENEIFLDASGMTPGSKTQHRY